MDSDKQISKDRIDAQKKWAARREEHFNNPSSNPFESIIRKLGNVASNAALEYAERKDYAWDHFGKDKLGGFVANSPVDKARFNVYQAMLKGNPSSKTLEHWNLIKQGEVPSELIESD
jgi:hypothetical protein